MKKTIIIAIILCSALSVKAQENASRDFIIPDLKEEFKTESIKSVTPLSQFNLKRNLLLPEFPTKYEHHQSKLDLGNNIYNLEHNFSYMLYSNSNVLYGFGSSYEAGGTILYQPFTNLTFSLGASGVKYSMNGIIFNDYLFSASMTYRFNNWLKLHLYGQYSMNSQRNAFAGGYYLSPKNCYGAVFMIKVVDKKKYSIDMNVGAERSYNPLNNGWEMNYRLGPEIMLK